MRTLNAKPAACIAACLVVVAATAALMPTSALAAEDDVFTGPHFGIEAGWESRKIDGRVPTDSADITIEDKRDDVTYGVFAGYDRQFGALVIGGEAGFTNAGKTLRAPIGEGGTLEIDPKWRLDLSARAGVTLTPRLLAYGRVGYSLERQRIAGLVDSQDAPLASEKVTTDGVSFGGGMEYAFGENLSIRAEYRRTELDGAQHNDRVLAGVTARF